jgi:plasmid stabilization system protein ParE
MHLRFIAPARTELREARRYYVQLHPILGDQFVREVRAAVERVLAHPEAWPIERESMRKIVLNRFPYKILYAIEASELIVLAVAHQHRRPDHWIDRLPR